MNDQCRSNLDFNLFAAGDGLFLKRQRPQGDIDPDASRRAQEDDPVAQRKLPGIGDSRLEMSQPFVDDGLLATEAGEQGYIDVLRKPWLTPVLDCPAANDAEIPMVVLANA